MTAAPTKLVDLCAVSNGCGGGTWKPFLHLQNFVGNTGRFISSSGHLIEVDFTDACNMHDAGYTPAIVKDPVNGLYETTDYRKWTRAQVDERFRQDLISLCEQTISRAQLLALTACETQADVMYGLVRTFGGLFFHPFANHRPDVFDPTCTIRNSVEKCGGA